MTYSEIKPISQTDGKHVKKSPVSNKQQRMNKQFKRIMMGRMMTGASPVKFPWTGHRGTWTSNRWIVHWTVTFRNLHITCAKGTTLTSPWSWH